MLGLQESTIIHTHTRTRTYTHTLLNGAGNGTQSSRDGWQVLSSWTLQHISSSPQLTFGKKTSCHWNTEPQGSLLPGNGALALNLGQALATWPLTASLVYNTLLSHLTRHSPIIVSEPQGQVMKYRTQRRDNARHDGFLTNSKVMEVSLRTAPNSFKAFFVIFKSVFQRKLGLRWGEREKRLARTLEYSRFPWWFSFPL